MLQKNFLLKNLEISSKDLDKSEITLEKLIQVNPIDFYYINLHKIIRINSLIKSINTCYLTSLFIDTKNYIY